MEPYSAEWYQQVLNALRDLVLVKGARSKLLWANKAFLDYYGMTEEDLYQIVDAPHSDPDDTLQYVIDDQKVFDLRDHYNIPSEAVTDALGKVRRFHTIKSPILEEGQVIRTVILGIEVNMIMTRPGTWHHGHRFPTVAVGIVTGTGLLQFEGVHQQLDGHDVPGTEGIHMSGLPESHCWKNILVLFQILCPGLGHKEIVDAHLIGGSVTELYIPGLQLLTVNKLLVLR